MHCTKLPSRAIISILDDYGDDANDDQACSTCKDYNRLAAHYTTVSSRAIIRMIFHARRQETSSGVLVKGLCGTVRPDLGLSISITDIQCIIHLRFVWTKIFLLIWALPSHIQNTPLVCQKCSSTIIIVELTLIVEVAEPPRGFFSSSEKKMWIDWRFCLTGV